MEIIIRNATENDIPSIHSLVYELAVYEKEPEAVTATPESYLRDFKAGLFRSIVAEADGKVVGMMLFFTMYSSWKGKMMYLDDFVITQSHRRFGIGQLLYDRLLGISKDEGCALLKWQVLDWNKPAIEFYQKNKAIIETDWWNVKVFL